MPCRAVMTGVLSVAALGVAGKMASALLSNQNSVDKSTSSSNNSDDEPLVKKTNEKKNIKAIFFDMDGTLLETKEIWYILLSEVSHKYGFGPVDREFWLKNLFGQSMQANCDRLMPGLPKEILDDYCFENFHKHIDLMEVFEGSIEALQLANDLVNNNTYITTNCPYPITKLIIASPKFAKLKEQLTNPDGTIRVICADDVVIMDGDETVITPKPNPIMIDYACSLVDTVPSETILVGDSIFDVQTIANAGGFCVAINQSSDCTISHISELSKMLHYFTFTRSDY